MKFVRFVHKDLGLIWYKYGWIHSLDNKVMNLYLRVSLRLPSTSLIILLYFQTRVVKCFDSNFLFRLKYCHLFVE